MHGMFLRLTHTGATSSSVYVADVEAVPTRVPTKQPGPVYVPVGGHVDLVFTAAVALSYESGNIRQFITTGLLADNFVYGDEYSHAISRIKRSPFVSSPGDIIDEMFWFPYPVRLWGLQCYAQVTPVTAGTYLLTMTSDGHELITGVSFDLTTLAPATITDVTLTSTTSHLEIPADTTVRLRVASNLGDLVSSGLVVQLVCGRRG